jgi:RNA polymerase sigma-70 factor (ECF subfamily)
MNRSVPTSDELLSQARGGDVAVLNHLLGLYRNYLCLLARTQIDSYLQVRLDPSDLVQETLVNAYQAFGDFQGHTEQELIAWLRKILVRRLTDEIRRHRTQKRDLAREVPLHIAVERTSDAVDASLLATHTSPSGQAARREHAVLLADALARLPDDYREVIILRDLQGTSFGEIGERMDRSAIAARTLWARALEKLRKELDTVL